MPRSSGGLGEGEGVGVCATATIEMVVSKWIERSLIAVRAHKLLSQLCIIVVMVVSSVYAWFAKAPTLVRSEHSDRIEWPA